jgi:hypothetical protein
MFEPIKNKVFLAILCMVFNANHLNAGSNQSHCLPQRSSFLPFMLAGTTAGSFQGRRISSGLE